MLVRRGTLQAVPARSGRQPTPWLLLIYTVPAQPSRKRATVWREIKKLGAVYLRDGVCVLPDQPGTRKSLRALASRIEEMDGEACLVEGAHLDEQQVTALKRQFGTSRSEEYAEISREAGQLLAHVARETEHREFTYPELEELEQDLSKLKRWTDQVRERDYFNESSHEEVQRLLEQCERALEQFLERASASAEANRHR